jgi:predicted PurR-regulated permease PerM
LQVVALLLIALSLWVLSPVLAPLAGAGFVVLLASRSYERLVVALHGRRPLAGVIATVAVTLAVFVPLGGALYLAGTQAIAAGHSLAQAVARAGGVDAFVGQISPTLRDRLPGLGDAAISTIVDSAGRLASWAPHIVTSAGWFAALALLAVVSTYYLFVQGPSFVAFLRRASPLRREQTDALLAEFHEVAVGLFRGNVVVALFHATSAAVGYAIFGVGHVFVLGAVTTIASFVPLVGTSLVWGPPVVGLILAHHIGRAIGLLVWCLLVVGRERSDRAPHRLARSHGAAAAAALSHALRRNRGFRGEGPAPGPSRRKP